MSAGFGKPDTPVPARKLDNSDTPVPAQMEETLTRNALI